MKRSATGLLLLSVLSVFSYAQQIQYTGTVALVQKGPDNNAAYYTNKISMKVETGGAAVFSANLKFGPKSEPADYISFNGTLNGTLDGNDLTLNGSLNQAMQDGKNFEEAAVTTRISGQKNGDVITGTFYMRYDGKEETTMTFTLKPGEMVPELLFPLGKSPKVFDKGWLFGAAFKITGKEEEQLDLSDNIKWSGTASFEPDKGASSRPTFNSVGENKIILTVEYEGKKYSKEYKVITVNAYNYARVGAKSLCPADAHGDPGDPRTCIGPVITGNANVLINGMPAVCEGDRGIHAICSGPNNFVIVDGDPDVLINGKKAAKLFTPTQHCGGVGKIVDLGGDADLSSAMQALSNDITITKNGQKLPNNSKPEAGTTMKTGPKGLLLMSPDRNSVFMLLPNSIAVITDAKGNDLIIQLENGNLLINGVKNNNNRNLIIETFNENLLRKGTRFLFSHSKDNSRLIVYEGEVEVQLKKDNSSILVPAGKVYFNDFKNPYTVQDTLKYQASDVLSTIPKDSAYWQLPIQDTVANENASKQSTDFMALLKQYWYAGAAVIVLLLLLLMRKRKK